MNAHVVISDNFLIAVKCRFIAKRKKQMFLKFSKDFSQFDKKRHTKFVVEIVKCISYVFCCSYITSSLCNLFLKGVQFYCPMNLQSSDNRIICQLYLVLKKVANKKLVIN